MRVRRGKCVSFAPWSMAEECIICSCSGSKPAQCIGISSWTTLYRASVIRNHNWFWRLQLKANFPKVPSNIIAIAELRCLFCKKSKYKPNTKKTSVQEFCVDDLNVPHPATYMIQHPGISVQNIPQLINSLLGALNFYLNILYLKVPNSVSCVYQTHENFFHCWNKLPKK